MLTFLQCNLRFQIYFFSFSEPHTADSIFKVQIVILLPATGLEPWMFAKTLPPPGCIFIDKRQLNQFLLLLNKNEDCPNLFLSKVSFSLASPSL